VSKTLKLTPTEHVTIVESSPEVLEVEASNAGSEKPPPKHLHPDQDERFEVLTGELRVRHGDSEAALGPGESRVRWETRPRGRTQEWFEAIDSLHESGHVRSNGMPGPLAFAALLDEYDDVFRLAVGPDRLVRAALKPLAAIGRTRGYG
jgi:hypothetical protein